MKFPYQKICFNLISHFKPRTQDIFIQRFGLKDEDPQTLEAIGQDHDLTRERVRQIVDEGVFSLRDSVLKKKEDPLVFETFEHFSQTLRKLGYVKREDFLVEKLQAIETNNHVVFLLTLGEQFQKQRETQDIYSFWGNKSEIVQGVPQAIQQVLMRLEKQKEGLLLNELERLYPQEAEAQENSLVKFPVFSSLLELSKHIAQGHDGRWGLKIWPETNPRGMKDKAYLALKIAGHPLHFHQVAQLIEELQPKLPEKKEKRVLSQTVHNELIKDPRFVLVGRGTYALVDWGYKPGTVRDLMVELLGKQNQGMSKEEVVKEIRKQRKVKESTIILNLQNKKYFLKDAQGRYYLSNARHSLSQRQSFPED